jgi:hypothetical protein
MLLMEPGAFPMRENLRLLGRMMARLSGVYGRRLMTFSTDVPVRQTIRHN